MLKSLAIGVDLGATKIASALVTSQGAVVASRLIPTERAQGAQAVLDRIIAEVNALIREAPGEIAGVGIGSPGLANSDQGIVQGAVNLGWREVRVGPEVQSRLSINLPVHVGKDTNASALGEYYFGAARGCDDFVYLSIGSGLGAGIISRGRLITGADWMAADIGHLSLDPNGRACTCGLRGCAETVVSGRGLIALTRELLAAQRYPTQLRDSGDLSARPILAAARRGDELALAAVSDMGQWFGMVMAVCAVLLNPSRIVIGGGLGLAAAHLLLPVAQREMRRRANPDTYRRLQVVLSRLTSSSAVGAACLVWSAQSR